MLTTPGRAGIDGSTTSTRKSKGPKGPKGLWGALATASTPAIGLRALPLADASAWRAPTSMFDYDRALAEDLYSDMFADLGIDPVVG